MTATKRPTIKKVEGLTLADSRLDVLRPDPALVEQYVSRNMPNGQTDLDYLRKCWDRRENVLLVGDTQGGKTMVVNVMAVIIGMDLIGMPLPVFTLSASSGITDYDLFGCQVAYTDPDDNVERIVDLPGVADMASRIGGIFYLDEINMMPERVTSSLHPVTDWRRGFTNRTKAIRIPGDGFMAEQVKVSDDLWIVGTMNPNYRGAGSLNEAFANRFRHLEWKYDPKVERRLIPNEGCRMLGTELRKARDFGDLRTPVGTAALMRLQRDVEEDGADMALYVLRSMFSTGDEKAKFDEIVELGSFQSAIVSLPSSVGAGWDPDGSDPSASPFA